MVFVNLYFVGEVADKVICVLPQFVINIEGNLQKKSMRRIKGPDKHL